MRAIDAYALRERLQSLAYDDWNQGITTSFSDACNEIIEIVEEQPTIEPERKTGHKINQHQHPAKWVCSECGARHFDFSDNFCSQCGVDVTDKEGAQDG